ncbi:MAG TPA: hypothetical protein DCQ31_02835, partial [Bacteroidales bacterium]|nr:hypothetical protein [Bacteroidales bacterium]
MNNRLLIVLLNTFVVSVSVAQTNYADYSALKKRIIFFDDFSDERNRWEIISGDSMNYTEVRNGYLCLNVINKSLEVFKNKQFDQKKDWEIEIAAKREINADATYGVGWGGVPKSQNRFLFLIDNRNFYIKKGKLHTFNRNNTETNRIGSSDQNTLTIRKIHSKIYFFINRKQVYSMPNEAWFGSAFSIFVEKEAKILIDYVSISYLEAVEIIDREQVVFANFNIRKTFSTKAYLNFEVANKNGISEIMYNGITIDFVSANKVPVSLYLNLQNKVNATEIKVTDGFGNTADTAVYIDSDGNFIKKSETKNENFNGSKKIALIIGNGNYVQTIPLINPLNDANLMTATLKKCGFETVTMQNVDIKTFNREFAKFVGKCNTYDVALFYFAGHGFNINKTNYLLFIDGVLDYNLKTVKNAIML